MTIFARPSEWTRAIREAAFATPFADRTHHYFAFLSYSHRDEHVAEWLHDALEDFRVPGHLVGRITEHGCVPRRLTPIFRDVRELPASSDLGQEIKAALKASRFLIVLCSPAAAQSKWVNAEIEAFKRVHPKACILAAILAGEPFASEMRGREPEECLPQALRFKYDRHGKPTAKRAEPLAADLRGNAQGRRTGFLKLVAGMLDVGLDDLVRRDEIRRHRHLAMVAAGSIAGMVVASGLALAAIQARDAARDQRREVEGLVAYMLGDLKDKLEPIGKLDALDGVGSRVLAYYEKQDASELSDAALLQRSQALGLTAQVAFSRGNLQSAQRLYRQALAGTVETIRRSPDDPQALFDHAQNVFWIGELAREQGQARQAETAYREYKRLADRMVAIEPDNLKWRMELAYANENLGIVLYNQRRFAEAVRQFEVALRPMESLAAIEPNNADYQEELSNVLAWLADAQRDLGKLDAAIAVRRRQIVSLEQLARSSGGNVEFLRLLIPAHQALGILLTWRGQSEPGLEQLRRAVGVAERLIPVEPDNVIWQAFAAGAGLELGDNLATLGQDSEARLRVREGCQRAARVLATSAGTGWRGLRTRCLAVRSQLAIRDGAGAQAAALAEQSLASARTERSEDPTKGRYSVAAAYRLLGDAQKARGAAAASRAYWERGLATLPDTAAERPSEMSARAQLLQRLGRAEDAERLIERLSAMGFKQGSWS
jgi:tetratricopeptide (TPR) repeat protein